MLTRPRQQHRKFRDALCALIRERAMFRAQAHWPSGKLIRSVYIVAVQRCDLLAGRDFFSLL